MKRMTAGTTAAGYAAMLAARVEYPPVERQVSEWAKASKGSIPSAANVTAAATVSPTYTRHSPWIEEISPGRRRPASTLCVSAAKSWNAADEPGTTTARKNVSIPRPPSHWVSARHSRRLWGRAAGSATMVMPVVVKPETASKYASRGAMCPTR